MAIRRLQGELQEIYQDTNFFFSVEPDESSFLKWNFLMIGPPDTFYEGGIFQGVIIFSNEYPNKPPQLKFTSEIFHPNIYKDGKVCISILHEGEDEWGYELASERWNPSHSVNSIMMSIISMLGDPNFESPADIDRSTMWKNNTDDFKNLIYSIVSKSQT